MPRIDIVTLVIDSLKDHLKIQLNQREQLNADITVTLEELNEYYQELIELKGFKP